jgi:hypothetical protein
MMNLCSVVAGVTQRLSSAASSASSAVASATSTDNAAVGLVNAGKISTGLLAGVLAVVVAL